MRATIRPKAGIRTVLTNHINFQATLKKKFVSCPAGGRNCGQSGGRKIVLFLVIFLFFGKKMMKF